jgi:hypothetical protein
MKLNNLMVQRKIKFLIFKTHAIECRTSKIYISTKKKHCFEAVFFWVFLVFDENSR